MEAKNLTIEALIDLSDLEGYARGLTNEREAGSAAVAVLTRRRERIGQLQAMMDNPPSNAPGIVPSALLDLEQAFRATVPGIHGLEISVLALNLDFPILYIFEPKNTEEQAKNT